MKYLYTIAAFLLMAPGQVFALGHNTEDPVVGGANNPVGSAILKNPLDDSISSIPKFFEAIIDIILVFAIPFVVFFIIYAGFKYVTARGNAETIKQAHNALLYALIGGLLILGAKVLLAVITGTVDQIK
ncbi:MAG: hypothetical protein ACI92I_000604 [Acidimicrobiales bacterium]|jgi:hypothetical protein